MNTSENEEASNVGQNQNPQNQEEPQQEEPREGQLGDLVPKKRNVRLPFLIILAVVLMVGLVYFFIQNRGLKQEVTITQADLNQAVLQLDSIGEELDLKILEITRLGKNVDTLLLVKAELEAEKRKLLTGRTTDWKAIESLRGKVEGYQELLIIKDQEIKVLKGQNEALFTENIALKVEKNQLSDSVASVAENRDQLSAQVAIASKLEVTDMRIFAINSKGKAREGKFRNRHVENLKVEFTVSENQVAPIEGKKILIRILSPDNNVLFDVTNGSSSFNFEGREMFYTVKEDILYERTSQKIAVLYKKGSEYARGKHTVEVYTDNYMMGVGSFVVK